MLKRLLVVALLLAGESAWAQGKDLAGAKKAFDSGEAHYAKGEWAAAIADYQQSYNLSQEPALLFNIAQAYRKTGDCGHSLKAYQDYLKLAAPPAGSRTRATAEEQMTAMKDCARPPEPEPEPKPVKPPVVRPPPRRPPIEEPIVDRNPGKGKKTAGAIMVAGGAVAVGVGVVFSLRAKGAGDDVTAKYGDPECVAMGCEWDNSLESKGKTSQTIAAILYGVGGAAIVGGGILYILGASQHPVAESVGLGPLPGGGAAMTWTGSF